jgi:hypothetical protein
MNDEGEDREKDNEVSRWLQGWRAPEASPGLRPRVLASHARVTGKPAWRRLWDARLSVPLPLALAWVVLFVVAAGFGWRGIQRGPSRIHEEVAGPARDGLASLRPLPEIQIRVGREK